jgi:hypothetical protein
MTDCCYVHVEVNLLVDPKEYEVYMEPDVWQKLVQDMKSTDRNDWIYFKGKENDDPNAKDEMLMVRAYNINSVMALGYIDKREFLSDSEYFNNLDIDVPDEEEYQIDDYTFM